MTASRRAILAAATGSLAAAAFGANQARATSESPFESQDWASFKQRFITADGRVVDTGNGGCSHSEGQGYGMLLAVAHNDQTTFDTLLHWTSVNLRRRTDSLHAWRYLPTAANKVPDTNNATDGDLMIALALARAARRWGRPDNAQSAAAIGRDVLRLLVRDTGRRTVLLPGTYGFEKPTGLIINLSYYMFPALAELEAFAPSPLWARLRDDGMALIADARFGRYNLPPDWLFLSNVDGGMAPAPGWPPRFSYDAIRVPLYLMWANLPAPQLEAGLAAFTRAHPGTPGWIDLNTNETANYAANAGQQAVIQLTTNRHTTQQSLPELNRATDYYAAALLMLTKLACRECQVA